MRLFRILTIKELKGYFLTPFGWVVLAFVTIMQGVSLSTAMKGFRDTPVKDSLIYVTFHTPVFWFYFLFIFPLITMRLFAEEERNELDERSGSTASNTNLTKRSSPWTRTKPSLKSRTR